MVETYRPRSLKDALNIRFDTRVLPFAGGTDLMVKKKSWSGTLPKFDTPVLFLDGLDEMKKIKAEGRVLRIGSAATLTEVLKDGSVPDVLKLAVREMSSPGIRNMATLGGNICNASPAGDTLPVLYTLGACLMLQNKNGMRGVPIEEFIKGPGKTALKDDELLTEIIIPMDAYNKVLYRKVGTRKANALSKLSFAGLARLSADRVEDVRIAFGAVAPTAVRVKELEDRIRNRAISEVTDMIPEITKLYEPYIRPIDDQRSKASYRKTVSLRILEQFLNSIMKSEV